MNVKILDEKSDPDTSRRSAAHVTTLDTSVLFGGAREVILLHKGECYRLRVTQSGKLILTK